MENRKTAAVDARSVVIRALVDGEGIDAVREELARAQLGRRTAQAYVPELLDLVVDAFALTGASADRPLTVENLAEQYLAEYEFRGRVDHRNLRYALTYPALIAGGLRPDLWDDIVYWRSELWPYALYAVVAYLRVASDRTGLPITDLAAALDSSRSVTVE